MSPFNSTTAVIVTSASDQHGVGKTRTGGRDCGPWTKKCGCTFSRKRQLLVLSACALLMLWTSVLFQMKSIFDISSHKKNSEFRISSRSFREAFLESDEVSRVVMTRGTLTNGGMAYEIGTLNDVPKFRVPNINCAALFAGDTAEKANAFIHQQMKAKQPVDEGVYIQLASDCRRFIANRQYTMRPLSTEEASFSIAYSMLLFRDVEQFERLLRSIYRPHNLYCLHVDGKSNELFFQAVKQISLCFDNVFLTSRRFNVVWGTFSVLEPEIQCMDELLRRSKVWRYFINLTGQEFPLKTNWDIVKILTVFNGSNNMEGTVKRRDNSRFTNQPPAPLNIRLTKGSVHIVASRAFVNFVLYDESALLFRDWARNIYIPDETYFSSLNHNAHIGAPGAYLGEPETDLYRNRFVARFKNWGDGPFDWKCYGMRVRMICVFGVGDLPLLASRYELFANKFYIGYEPLALDCLEELHYNRTRDEVTGVAKFDVSFYETLSFVEHHQ